MGIDFNLLGMALAQGTLIQYAPGILEGAMAELLPLVRVKSLDLYIKSGMDLWSIIPPNNQRTIIELGPKLGPLDWLTLEWIMETGRTFNPSLYSALQEWPEGTAWLEAQLADIKKHMGGS